MSRAALSCPAAVTAACGFGVSRRDGLDRFDAPREYSDAVWHLAVLFDTVSSSAIKPRQSRWSRG
jgi:hypothetical protein